MWVVRVQCSGVVRGHCGGSGDIAGVVRGHCRGTAFCLPQLYSKIVNQKEEADNNLSSENPASCRGEGKCEDKRVSGSFFLAADKTVKLGLKFCLWKVARNERETLLLVVKQISVAVLMLSFILKHKCSDCNLVEIKYKLFSLFYVTYNGI